MESFRLNTYKSPQEHLLFLIERGLIVADEEQAAHTLQHVHFYRLQSYWKPFLSEGGQSFRKGTTFEAVIALYEFDRLFRVMILECIERIEVSVRSAFIDIVSSEFGNHGHLQQDHARSAQVFYEIIERHGRETRRFGIDISKSAASQAQMGLLPIWDSCEMMSLGTMSKWIGNVLKMRLVNKIARKYHLPARVLISWLHHLNVTRNTSAHHGRLWNRSMTIVPVTRVPNSVSVAMERSSRKIYNTLVILLYLRNIIEPQNTWKSDLLALIDQYSIDVSQMGFPSDWMKRDLWQA